MSAAALAQLLPVKTYTTADGLARDRVTRIRTDSRGFLWFCTEEGLSRFDGYRFTNYTPNDGLPSPNVRDFLETREGIYWVGTYKGLCRFDPSQDEGAMFTLLSTDDGKEMIVASLFEDSRGTVWCGSSRGVLNLEREGGDWRLRDARINAFIYNFIEDRNGSIWMSTGVGLYRRLPDGRTERYTRQDGLPSNSIRGLLEHADGSIWVGTLSGLCRLKREIVPGTNIVDTVIKSHGDIPIGSNWLYQSRNGHVWACGGQGLFELFPDRKGYGVKHYSTGQGLSGTFIWAMIEDRDGNSWIATNTGGVMKMARNGLTTWRKDDGLGTDFVMGISETPSGELLVTGLSPTGLLISRFDGERFVPIRPLYPAEISDVGNEAQQRIIQDRTGEWWIPTASGLLRYPKIGSVEMLARTRPKAIYTSKDGLGGDHVFRLFEDSRGDIWIGAFLPGSARSHVTRWERKTEKFHHYSSQDGVPEGTPSGFSEDSRGNIWMAFHGGYAARYQNGRFMSFQVVPPSPGRRTHDVYCDRSGRVWIGTAEAGVLRIDNPNEEQPEITFYTVKDGLSSNDVWGITEDDLGNIYFGTGRGLDRMNPLTKQIKHYTTIDGLTSNYVLMLGRDRHGAIWAGTQRGVSRLIPEPDPPVEPPPVFINSIRIAGKQYSVSALGETSLTVPDLDPGQSQLNIDFFGLSLAAGDTLRYQYILEGAGIEWSELSERRNVDFANLTPGSYRFVVRAVTADGTESANPASVTFRILRPVWQRWWFLAIAGVVIASATFAIRRQRVSRRREREQADAALRQAKEERLRELEQVRRRIAADLHDDIGSNLTRISLLSEVAQRRVEGDGSPVKEQLSNIAGLSRELVDSMSEIVWAINPQKDHLGDLTQKMRHFASDLLTARQIDFRFSAADLDSDIKVGANVRREFFLIFKEGVNNIARHSDCARVEIEFRVEDNRLILTLNDDGKGFDLAEKSSGHGLASMRERTLALGGRLEIDSRQGLGTALRFDIPLASRAEDPA
ncbi:MAG: histidine kinase [Blastocatellia bacterium]|nr:histidine kinase [Blastocatellia bacterium]